MRLESCVMIGLKQALSPAAVWFYLRQIVANAGKEGAVIVEKVRAEKNPNVGYNAATETFEDLVAAGVIDPAKVTRCALQNAASIAGLMLTTEALISELQDDDKPRAMPGGMDM